MKKREIVFEESLSDEWSKDLDVIEVPLDERPFWYLGVAILLVALAVVGRIAFLSFARGGFYESRAAANQYQTTRLAAPRGPITDREGRVLAENRPVYSALLNLKEFLRNPALHEATFLTIRQILDIPEETVRDLIRERNVEAAVDPIVLLSDLQPAQVVALRDANLETLIVLGGFERQYPLGAVFSSAIGYLGFPTAADLKRDRDLAGQDLIGKAGLEAYYDERLRGTSGLFVRLRDAKGNIVGEQKRSDPKIGETLRLTIDGEFQEYFHDRFARGLASLGRTSGVGMALNPQNGEVLAFFTMPAYDNNAFTGTGKSAERQRLLTSPDRPLFNRAVSGLYNPGSTVKPLVAVAALIEGVISPTYEIFSPGYLDVPNPYNPDQPTRFVDWRYQGNVDLSSALAQSSNVYFYEVGGGFGDLKGLGINRLREWWAKFGFDRPTGIDLPGEARGFLPSPEWREEVSDGKRPWLVGDTYNVSIGQGDLLVTPIELLNYIATIANGGHLYEPTLVPGKSHPKTIADLDLGSALLEVQKGMRETVTSPLGTAHLLSDLSFAVAAKTGSAQVQNNTQENAFFVGYAPANDPQVAILVLIENAKEGSLNAVPIGKDALAWYYEHRIKK